METIQKVTLTSNCKCYDCTNADCMTLNISEDYEPECDSCQSPTKAASYCDGLCYEADYDYFAYTLFPDWYMSKREPKWLKVSGKNVGWRRISGYDKVRGGIKPLFDYLTFNGDWTLKFTVEEGNLTVRRYSHDEPTGCTYTIEALNTLSDSMSIDNAIANNLVDEYGCHKKCGEYFYDCNCEVEA